VLQVRGPRRGRCVLPRATATAVHRSLIDDGYAVARGVVGDAYLARAREWLDALPDTGAIRTAPLELLGSLVEEPALVKLAESALGGSADAFGCTFIVKPARIGLPARWHQDGDPWEARGIRHAVSLGVAIDASTEENGCLRVIPGSHRLPSKPLRPITDPPNVFGVEIDPMLVDETLAVAVPLAPGDVSLHVPTLIHGSDANRSDTPRTTLVIRYRAGG
jgi:phytanoyl-CoA hydroxylase